MLCPCPPFGCLVREKGKRESCGGTQIRVARRRQDRRRRRANHLIDAVSRTLESGYIDSFTQGTMMKTIIGASLAVLIGAGAIAVSTATTASAAAVVVNVGPNHHHWHGGHWMWHGRYWGHREWTCRYWH